MEVTNLQCTSKRQFCSNKCLPQTSELYNSRTRKSKPTVSRRKEITESRAEVNEIETEHVEKINRIYKTFVDLLRKRHDSKNQN